LLEKRDERFRKVNWLADRYRRDALQRGQVEFAGI